MLCKLTSRRKDVMIWLYIDATQKSFCDVMSEKRHSYIGRQCNGPNDIVFLQLFISLKVILYVIFKYNYTLLCDAIWILRPYNGYNNIILNVPTFLCFGLTHLFACWVIASILLITLVAAAYERVISADNHDEWWTER